MTRAVPGLPGRSTESITVAGADLVHGRVVHGRRRRAAPRPATRVQFNGVHETFDATATPAGWSVVNNTTTVAGASTTRAAGQPHRRRRRLRHDRQRQARHPARRRTPNCARRSSTSPARPRRASRSTATSGPSRRPTADVDLSLDGGATWQTAAHYDRRRAGSAYRAGRPPAGGRQGQRAGAVPLHRQLGPGGGRSTTSPSGHRLRAVQRWPGRRQRHRQEHRRGHQRRHRDQRRPPAEKATTARRRRTTPNLGDGFYWLFSSLTGTHPFTASLAPLRRADQVKVNVASNWTATADFALARRPADGQAGGDQEEREDGRVGHRQLDRQERRRAPATVSSVSATTASPCSRSRAPARRCKQSRAVSPDRMSSRPAAARRWRPPGRSRTRRRTRRRGPTSPTTRRWSWTTPPRTATARSTRSAAGRAARPAGGQRLRPGQPAPGRPSPNMATAREKPAAAYVNGKLYVVGGWGDAGPTVALAGDLRPARQHLDAPGRPRRPRTPPRRSRARRHQDLRGRWL